MADELLRRKLDTLPPAPGVYLWKDAEGRVLYVGKAQSLRSRTRSYFTSDHAASPKNALLVRLIADVETIVVASEADALLLENNLIKEHQPRFNVRLKDDKSYPSIVVTMDDPFPRVLVTRRPDIPGGRSF
ncbi:MAG: GIY-YIG nuclease family protein, partial [Gemmatimonadales bacterium]|nr:GIY-YIG nuclease family protein [Gemmatimonadales bacterium]